MLLPEIEFPYVIMTATGTCYNPTFLADVIHNSGWNINRFII